MKNVPVIAAVVVGISLLAARPLSSTIPPPGQSPESVVVVNSPAVGQSGTWTVRNADERGRQPYHETVNVYSNSGEFASGTISIPAGKRLVVEYISAYALGPGPAVVALHPGTGDFLRGAWLSVDKQRNAVVPGGFKTYYGGEMVRYYGEPGGTLTVTTRVEGATVFNSYVNVIGYLVDVP